MADISEKNISILTGNLNSVLGFLITTANGFVFINFFNFLKWKFCAGLTVQVVHCQLQNFYLITLVIATCVAQITLQALCIGDSSRCVYQISHRVVNREYLHMCSNCQHILVELVCCKKRQKIVPDQLLVWVIRVL